MSGSLADGLQERKAWQGHYSALDGINGPGGGEHIFVDLRGSFLKPWTTMWRSE